MTTNYPPQYSRTSQHHQQSLHNIQPGYNMTTSHHQPGYIPNIPNPSLAGGYSLTPGPPVVTAPQIINPYSCQQPSPDSQGFANMNLASPQHKPGEDQYNYDPEVENVSGKLDSFTLSDVLDSLNVQPGLQPTEEPRRGKRSQHTAALESGSNVVPREMARMVGGGGLEAVQAENTGNYAGYLNNCRQMNDL